MCTKATCNELEIVRCIIDFEKVLASVNKNLLCTILLKNDIKGKLLRATRATYANNVKVIIRCGSLLAYLCSPVLFSLFN